MNLVYMDGRNGAAHYFIDDRTQSTVIEDKHQDFRKLKKEELIKILEETYRERDHDILPFIIAGKKIKHHGIKLTKEVKDFYNENLKPLKKEIESDTDK